MAISAITRALRGPMLCAVRSTLQSALLECRLRWAYARRGMRARPKRTRVVSSVSATRASRTGNVRARRYDEAGGEQGSASRRSRSPPSPGGFPAVKLTPLRIRPSKSSCCMILNRLAPSAPRTAISRCRVVARTRKRLVTLTQAMSQRTPAAASRARSPFLRLASTTVSA